MHRFFCKETGRWIPDPKLSPGHYAYGDLRDEVSAHYRANHIPLPSELDAVIQGQECERLPAGWCKDEYGVAWAPGGSVSRFSFAAFKQGTATLLDWFLHGREKVSVDIIQERTAICSRCEFNRVPENCTTCGTAVIHDMINQVVGGEALPTDVQLNGCAVCLCSLKALVRLPISVIQRHVSQEQFKRLPDHCWKKEGIAVEGN